MRESGEIREGAKPRLQTDPDRPGGDKVRDALPSCRICGSRDGEIHRVREMMFGFGDVFDYLECSECGCLQLLNPPADMARFYPANSYYSFKPSLPTANPTNEGPSPSRLIRLAREWFSHRQNEAAVFELGGIFELLARRHQMEEWVSALKKYVSESPERTLRARILDVGCGSGALLLGMACFGFSRLDGVDPYLKEPVNAKSYRIRNVDVRTLNDETYDLILMNHSLEHIPDQIETLTAIRGLLDDRGVCRIEVPVADCEAWSAYGADWVEIDAPRHYFLHTRKSFAIASNAAGLEVYRIDDVGTPFEFWGSELYRRGLPFFEAAVNDYRDPRSIFSEADMAEFERRSTEVSRQNKGGRLAFYLRRAGRQPADLARRELRGG